MAETDIPSPAGADAEEWTCRDGDDYPLVGRVRDVQLGDEVVSAEAIAGWLHDGQPTPVTVETEDGWLHIVDESRWDV